MAKRGRKAEGEFSDKLANFSTRIRPETRKALEAEAKAVDQSISQLAERLLVDGLAERRLAKEDRPMRALCFLIGQLAHHIVGMHVTHEKSDIPIYDWRSDPFFYRAFKIAVGQLLDALEPPGPIKAYEFDVNQADASMKRYLASFKTPEARAEYSVDWILAAFRGMPHWSAQHREEQRKILSTLPPSFTREFYGMPNAAEDLAITPYSGRTTPVTVNVRPIFYEKGPKEPKS